MSDLPDYSDLLAEAANRVTDNSTCADGDLALIHELHVAVTFLQDALCDALLDAEGWEKEFHRVDASRADDGLDAAGYGPPGVDGTPGWAYDEDGYCVCCGNGRWKHHMPECRLRDALEGGCPFVLRSDEGTSHCSLAERDGQLVAKARDRVHTLIEEVDGAGSTAGIDRATTQFIADMMILFPYAG